jgi:hypothetical protein
VLLKDGWLLLKIALQGNEYLAFPLFDIFGSHQQIDILFNHR